MKDVKNYLIIIETSDGERKEFVYNKPYLIGNYAKGGKVVDVRELKKVRNE